MKLKSFFLTALAASMALVSCNNEEAVEVPVDNQPKSVKIDLANVVAAAGRNMQAAVAGGSQVQLNSFQIIFADAQGNLGKDGELFQGKDATNATTEGAVQPHYFGTITTTTLDDVKQLIYHFLPAEVSKVAIVANRPEISLDASKNLTDIEGALTIAAEQDPTALYLYDVQPLKIQNQDVLGHPLYVATLNLAPRVARIEIVNFKYNETGAVDANGVAVPRKYAEISVQQILLNNFYEGAEPYTGLVTGDKINKTISLATAFGVLADANTLENSGDLWYNDVLPATLLNATTSYTKDYTAAGVTERPAYHFFSNATAIGAADHPQVIVKLLAKDAAGTEVPHYLATSVFNPAVTADFAKIYQLSFEFDDDDLEDPEKCVQLTVKVVNWAVQTVTPEFQ